MASSDVRPHESDIFEQPASSIVSLKEAEGSIAKATSEEDDNYMELFVEKEIKQKVDPLQDQLDQRKEEIEKLVTKLRDLDETIIRVDKHYNGVAKALLTKQGILMNNVSEIGILKEFSRITDKEASAKQRLKKKLVMNFKA